MAQVLTLSGYTPPARYDDLPWTIARLDEATSEAGSYTLLEDITLDPVDSDPVHPLTRSFTVEDATVGNWYRITWVDDDGDESAPESPAQFIGAVEAYATTDDLFRLLGIENPSQEQTADGERVLLAAAGEIESEIGRSDLAGWEVALATEVNLERAVEHWGQLTAPFGILGLGDTGPIYTARDSWDRHGLKLAPLKRSWGLA